MSEKTDPLKHLLALLDQALDSGKPAYMDVDAYQSVVDHLLLGNQPGKARQACEMGLLMHPYSADLLITAGNLAQLEGDLKQAIEHTEKGLSIDPYHGQGWLLFTDLTLSDHTAASLLKSLEDVKAISSEQELVILAMGMCLQQLRNPARAIQLFKQVIDASPRNELAWQHLVDELEGQDRLRQHIPYFQEKVDEDPFNYSAWYYLGQAYNHVHQWDKAVEAFDFCTVIDDKLEEGWLMKASALMNQKSYAEARIALQRLLELQPKHLEGTLYLAACYEQEQSYDTAIALYKKVTSLQPDTADGWYGVGCCMLAQDRNYEAIHWFNRALQLDKQRSSYWFGLAQAEYRMGNIISADEAYEEACNWEPTNPDIYLEWSFIYYDSGDYDRAISLITSGIEECPDNADLYYRAVVYLLSQGSVREGFVYLQKALLLNFEKHEQLFEFFQELETQKALFKIIDQYRH